LIEKLGFKEVDSSFVSKRRNGIISEKDKEAE